MLYGGSQFTLVYTFFFVSNYFSSVPISTINNERFLKIFASKCGCVCTLRSDFVYLRSFTCYECAGSIFSAVPKKVTTNVTHGVAQII